MTAQQIQTVRGVLLLELEGTETSMAIELTAVRVQIDHHEPDYTYRSMACPPPRGHITVNLDAVVPRYVVYEGRPEMPDEQATIAATRKEIAS